MSAKSGFERVLGAGRLVRALAGEKGSMAVDFALAAPILLGLVFGIMEVGRAVFTQAILYYAAQQTARFALVTPPADTTSTEMDKYRKQLETYAKSRLFLINPNNLAPNISAKNTNALAGDTRMINIDLSYNFQWMMPFISNATGPITLSSSATGFLAENN